MTNRPALIFEGFGGLSLAGEMWGAEEDPAVVLVHGGCESRLSMAGAAKALAAAGRHVLAYDLRGHGESAWAADGRYDLDAHVGDLRAALGLFNRRPVVIGSSMGGLIALAALGEDGEHHASGLILVDAVPWLEEAGSQRLEPLLRENAAGYISLEAAAIAAAALRPHRLPPSAEMIARHVHQDEDGRFRWRWDPRFVGADALKGTEQRLEAAAARIKLPTLLMHGAESELVSAESERRMHELIAGSELMDIAGAGHLVAGDQSDAFNAAVLEFLERRVPRAPVVYEAGSDARTLRDALGCFGTGVTVVATRKTDGGLVGLTANSFTSVSLDPPLVLFCLARSSSNSELFATGISFSINVLHIGQQEISTRFARHGAQFEGLAWESWESGAPIVSGALASLECAPHAVYDGGDHLIVVGRVIRARFEPQRDPLLFFRGKYRRLHFK